MFSLSLRLTAALMGAAILVVSVPAAQAQGTGDQKSQEQGQKPTTPPGDAAKEEKEKKQRVDEIAEAARVLNGPAGNPDCVWLGRRVISRLWNDDLDTAFRHLELYDRFGCPGEHVQQSFRCLVRQGSNADLKSPESLNARVHACWLNPSQPPVVATPAPGTTNGTPPQETR